MGLFGGKPEPIEQEKQNIKDVEAKIEKNFQDLGRLMYETHRMDIAGDEAYNALIVEIDGNYVQKKVHYDEWLKLQGLLQCAHCNEQISYGSKFCNFCGANVEDQYPAAPPAETVPEASAPAETVPAEAVPEQTNVQ